jgi:hypothetical protein
MKTWVLVLTTIVCTGVVYSAEIKKSQGSDKGVHSISDVENGQTWSKKVKQGFSMQVWMSNQMVMGIQAWTPLNIPADNCANPGLGLDYPAGTCFEHLYGAAPMIGGLIDGVRRVSEGYNGDNAGQYFIPEEKDTARDKIWQTNSGTETFHPNNDGYSGYYWRNNLLVNRPACDDDGDGKVDEDELDGLDNDGDWNPLTDDIGSDGLPDNMEVSCDGKPYDATANPDPAYDNWDPSHFDKCHIDANGNYIRKSDKNKYTQNNGIADHGEPHVDEDYAALSDNDLYFAATDTFKKPVLPGHFAMGVKIFAKSYAWRGNFAEAILPIEYNFINVGHHIIHNAYVGFFADMDIGPVNDPSYPSHDYSCYFPELRTAYIANAQDRGATPLGITVLGTPRPLDSLDYIYQWHGFQDPGTVDSNIYSWMSGEHWGYDKSQYIRTCQSPSSPTDTRFFFSFGPFDGPGNDHTGFKPGDTLKISVALVGGEGVESGNNNLKDNAKKALQLFLDGFRAPTTLPALPLKITEGFKRVTLEWGTHVAPPGSIDPLSVWDDSNRIAEDTILFPPGPNNFRRNNPPCEQILGCGSGHHCITLPDGSQYLPGGRIFEGYRLYRSEDQSFIGHPFDPLREQPDPKSWTLLKQYDIPGDKFEYNVGIDTVFVDSNLVRGYRYWYAVTSFGIPNIRIVKVKDSNGNVHNDTLQAASTESPFIGHPVDVSFSASDKPDQVLVVPNPYRTDVNYTSENHGYEVSASRWDEEQRLVKFIHLPRHCIIRVFTLVGDLVATIPYDAPANDPNKGEINWKILSDNGRALASGIYVYTVESDLGNQVGKFVLIR